MKEDPCKNCPGRFERISCGICNIPKAYKRELWLQSLKVGDIVVYRRGSEWRDWRYNHFQLLKITAIMSDNYIQLDWHIHIPKDTGVYHCENSINDEAIFPYTDEEFPENPFDENTPLISMKYIIEYHKLIDCISLAQIKLCNVDQLKQIIEILKKV